jgi:hypothetical protein
MFRKERSLKNTRGSFEIVEAQNVQEGMKPRKYQGLISNRGSTKRLGRNEASKIPGAHLKSRKHKTFQKERSLKNTEGSFEIAKHKTFWKE